MLEWWGGGMEGANMHVAQNARLKPREGVHDVVSQQSPLSLLKDWSPFPCLSHDSVPQPSVSNNCAKIKTKY